MGAIEWFGNLQLAFKYALVFGTLLVMTLVLGFFKVLYNRRKMKNIIKKEGDAGARSDEEELNMREKDEGDLFGIRAIEAGFFGGVAQSRPTSAVNSPVGTPRGGSPAPSNRNSLIGSKPFPNGANSRAFSPSGSSMNLSQYGQRQSSADTIEAGSPHTAAPSGLRKVSNFADPGEGRSGARKSPPSPVRIPGAARLQPSDAELHGRINHSLSVNMSLEVPPSPMQLSPPHHQEYHELASPRSPTPPSGEPESSHLGDDQRLSTASERYSWRRSVVEHYAREDPPQLSLPQDLGKSALPIYDTQNPHGQARSIRASIVSSTSKAQSFSNPPSPGVNGTLDFPTYPPRAMVEPSQRQYNDYRGAAKSPMTSPIAEASDPLIGSHSPNPFPTYHDRSMSNHSSHYGGEDTYMRFASHDTRDSFSYEGEAHRPPRPTKKVGESIPMSTLQPKTQRTNQAAGHYVPTKPDNNHQEYVPSPGGKGGDFF